MTAHRPYGHTLIVGGTGMLAGASLTLAGASQRLTSVARTRRSLAALDADLRDRGCVHHPLALDWNDPERFLDAIDRHLAATRWSLPPRRVAASTRWTPRSRIGRWSWARTCPPATGAG